MALLIQERFTEAQELRSAAHQEQSALAYKVTPLSVRSIEADSSGEAIEQFAEEANRLQAIGQAASGVGRFLVELADDKGCKMGSVSVHHHGIRESEPP